MRTRKSIKHLPPVFVTWDTVWLPVAGLSLAAVFALVIEQPLLSGLLALAAAIGFVEACAGITRDTYPVLLALGLAGTIAIWLRNTSLPADWKLAGEIGTLGLLVWAGWMILRSKHDNPNC